MYIQSLIKPEINYTTNGNVYYFITDESERPFWSRMLDDYYNANPRHLQMKRQYKLHCDNIRTDPQKRDYLQFITELGGVTVDLASGPSGYFSPVFNYLKSGGVFIATDACTAVINAHQKVNQDKRFYIFDVDLDKGLPFKDASIDAFSGNLLNNVEHYIELLKEISRCLKSGGRFAVIEMFYETGSKTYDYLKEKDAVYTSLEHYIEICSALGLKYKDSKIRREFVGKISDGDLLPIGENDKCMEMYAYFEKV